MDQILIAWNAVACVLLAAGFAWAILHPRVALGVIDTFGLIVAAIGCLALAVAFASPTEGDVARAAACMHAGLLLFVLGRIRRARKLRRRLRRVSDWMDLDAGRSAL